jgi:hypothetical protein
MGIDPLYHGTAMGAGIGQKCRDLSLIGGGRVGGHDEPSLTTPWPELEAPSWVGLFQKRSSINGGGVPADCAINAAHSTKAPRQPGWTSPAGLYEFSRAVRVDAPGQDRRGASDRLPWLTNDNTAINP